MHPGSDHHLRGGQERPGLLQIFGYQYLDLIAEFRGEQLDHRHVVVREG